jgi:hypothetical protein
LEAPTSETYEFTLTATSPWSLIFDEVEANIIEERLEHKIVWLRNRRTEAIEMGNLLPYQSQCRKVLCLSAKRRETMTYGRLAAALDLKSPRQQWSTLLNPLSETETATTGADLTLIVVYASGPAEGLSRYFSNVRGGATPGTTMLDPGDAKQVAAYQQELEKVFDVYAKVNC